MNIHHLPYAVVLSSASEFSMGPTLVYDYMRRATRLDASALAATVEHAQPGIKTAIAVETPDGWRVGTQTVREWVESL